MFANESTARREYMEAKAKLDAATEEFNRAAVKLKGLTGNTFLAQDAKKGPKDFNHQKPGTGNGQTDC